MQANVPSQFKSGQREENRVGTFGLGSEGEDEDLGPWAVVTLGPGELAVLRV